MKLKHCFMSPVPHVESIPKSIASYVQSSAILHRKLPQSYGQMIEIFYGIGMQQTCNNAHKLPLQMYMYANKVHWNI